MVVGDALGRPDAADVVLAFAKDLHLPHLFGVGNSDALTAIAIAIDLDEIGNETYGITSRGATLQSHAFELLNHEHTGRVDQSVGTAESAFANGELMFVQTRISRVEISVGVGHFGDGASKTHTRGVASERGVHGAFVHRVHFASGMVGGGFHIHPCAITAITCMGCDDAAIFGCLLAHHNAGAALTFKLWLAQFLSHGGIKECQQCNRK